MEYQVVGIDNHFAVDGYLLRRLQFLVGFGWLSSVVCSR